MSIIGNMVGGSAPLKTVILTDENGNEIATGVVTESEVVFTATDNDVREGMVYASDSGVSTGTKEIPIYHSTEGSKLVTNGSKFILPIQNYEYTKLQAIICSYNTNITNSVSAEKVAINGNLYPVQSTEAESAITVDTENQRIDFGITNTSGKLCLIRYFIFKEIY